MCGRRCVGTCECSLLERVTRAIRFDGAGDAQLDWTAELRWPPVRGGRGRRVSKATETDEERQHWDRNRPVFMGTVLNEGFAVSRAAQGGIGSRAQTHAVYGRTEPALQAFHRDLASLCGREVR